MFNRTLQLLLFPCYFFGFPLRALTEEVYCLKQATSLTILARETSLVGGEESDCLLSCSHSASLYFRNTWTASCDISVLVGKSIPAPILGLGGGICRQIFLERECHYVFVSFYSSFLEIDSREDIFTFFPSCSIGATAQKTMDPIVLECSIGGQFFLPQKIEEYRLCKGITFFLEPSCFFWITSDFASFVTTKWKVKCSDSLENRTVNSSRIQTQIAFGFRYTGLDDQAFGLETGFTTLDPKQAFMTLQGSWKKKF